MQNLFLDMLIAEENALERMSHMLHMKTGLTSVTLRQKSPEEIIALAKEAGLTGIEWGGDVHVPAGDVKTAASIGRKTREAGLSVLSYGSYFHGDQGEDFAPALESAKALGAPLIRVWAGRKTLEESSAEEIEDLAGRFREAAEMAQEEGMDLAFEYHRGTATQTITGALEFLKAIRACNVSCYWQPNPELTKEDHLAEIDALLPFLSNVHVFSWDKDSSRFPLRQGEDGWLAYLGRIREGGKNRALILEFVKGDSPEQFRTDAAVLKEWASRLAL